MSILGAHQSIAGGYYRAVERAVETGCDCVQVFTKNNNQWRAKAITAEEVVRFQQAIIDHKIKHTAAHASYLINLASPDAELWQKSLESFLVEMQRADLLGIPYVVVHPGSFTSSTEEQGLARVALAVNEMHRRLPDLRSQCLLENTAGQGTNLGWQFDHLAEILRLVEASERLGVCFDTCHAHAAGYPLSTAKDYRATMRTFDRSVGLDRIRVFHLNDSKNPLGARVDRHEHIGRGQLGAEAFRLLLADRRFRKVPMYLETPKGEEEGENLDAVNLRVLRELAATSPKK